MGDDGIRDMRYRTFGVTFTPHGRDKLAACCERKGTAKVLSSLQADLLRACDSFGTLDEHAARNWLLGGLLDEPPSGKNALAARPNPREVVRTYLESFVDDGFLVSEAELDEDIRARFVPSSDLEENASNEITSIGIPTRDRPDSLQRVAESVLESLARFERTATLVVIDDSREAVVRAQNEKVLRILQSEHDVSIRYADRDRRNRIAEDLASQAGISSDVLRFALLGDSRCPNTIGACRNALQLDSAGELALQTDDDTVFRIVSAPDRLGGLRLTSEINPYEYWFFDRFEDALASVSVVDLDILGLHEQLLGRAVRDCIDSVVAAGETLRFDEIGPSFLTNHGGSDAGVAVSFLGTVGDSGTEGHACGIFHGGKTYERLIETEEVYRRAIRTRQILRAATQTTISEAAFCMTTHIGFDQRTLLPPFMPMMRNEDGLFGTMLNTYGPGRYKGYLPYAVLHQAPDARLTGQISFRPLRANDLLQRVVVALSDYPSHPDPAQNLCALGRRLLDLCALPHKDLADFLRTVAHRTVNSTIEYVERWLDERPDAPSYWIDDGEAYLQSAEEAVVHPELAIPSDLEGSADQRQALFQDLTHRFGALLTHWPDIDGAVRARRERGLRLSQAL